MEEDKILLEFDNVSMKIKGFELKDIAFTVRQGYITVLTGSNGSGKTTLMSLVSRKYKNYSGNISVYGTDIKKNRCMVADRLGVISEDNSFFMECDAIENEQLLSGFYTNWDSKRYKNILNELSVSTSTPIKNLSRGNYVRFQLAFAIAHRATLYIMDEPTAGLDPIYKREFFKTLQSIVAANDAAVLISTNILSDLDRIADYIVNIEDGVITKNCSREEL